MPPSDISVTVLIVEYNKTLRHQKQLKSFHYTVYRVISRGQFETIWDIRIILLWRFFLSYIYNYYNTNTLCVMSLVFNNLFIM